MINSIQHFAENGIPKLEESQKNFMQNIRDRTQRTLLTSLGQVSFPPGSLACLLIPGSVRMPKLVF